MRIGEHEFGTRELHAHIAQTARQWQDPPAEIKAGPFRGIDMRERFRPDWPDEEGLLALRRARVRTVRDVLLRITHGQSVDLAEVTELVNELLGVFLDSPWRAAHLALVHNYRWRGADDESAGHDADYALEGHCAGSLAEHALSTALLSIGAAVHLGWAAEHVRHAGMTALLQDVGTLLLPTSARRPSGKEDGTGPSRAWQRHPALSLYALRDLPGLPEAVLQAVYHHEERENAQGFPDRLPAAKISPLAKLTAVADAYMTPLAARRGEPPALPTDSLLQLIKHAKANFFDRDCVRALVRCAGLYPPGSAVKLSTGRLAFVLAVAPRSPDRPIVLPLSAGDEAEAAAVDLRRPEQRLVRIRSAEPRWLIRAVPRLAVGQRQCLRAHAA